jgi:hypothetical protein
MLLGLHTYSLHLHGMGQNWGGFPAELGTGMGCLRAHGSEAVKLGLDGLHLTAVDLGSTDPAHLSKVRVEAEERGLYLEYNFSLDSADYDPRLTNTMEEGIRIAAWDIGSDIGKISMDIHRPSPVCGSAFHPEVLTQLERVAGLAQKAAAPIGSGGRGAALPGKPHRGLQR